MICYKDVLRNAELELVGDFVYIRFGKNRIKFCSIAELWDELKAYLEHTKPTNIAIERRQEEAKTIKRHIIEVLNKIKE